MSESLQIALTVAGITGLVNAAVTWGVISTQLAWLRRDVDLAHSRIDAMAKSGARR